MGDLGRRSALTPADLTSLGHAASAISDRIAEVNSSTGQRITIDTVRPAAPAGDRKADLAL
jgi:hypothetical protein